MLFFLSDLLRNILKCSDFIGDFGKLPFPEHLGKYFIKNWENKCLNTGNWENKGHFWIGNDSHIRLLKWPNKITEVQL